MSLRALASAAALALWGSAVAAECRLALALGLDVSGSVDVMEYRLQLDGVANATEVMVGKAKGQQDQHSLKLNVNIALFWTAIFALAYSLMFYLAGDYFIMVISNIPTVVDYAQQHLAWLVALPLLACWCYLYDGVYVGLMQAHIMRNSMLVATFGCFFPTWWLLSDYGNHGLWAAFSIFMLARGATLAWHYQRHKDSL